jgi:hypothetical protein
MTFLDLTDYFIISSKLVGAKFKLLDIKELARIVFIMVILSFIMGVLGVSPIGKYNFLYGMIISIFFIYFLYNEKLKKINLYIPNINNHTFNNSIFSPSCVFDFLPRENF